MSGELTEKLLTRDEAAELLAVRSTWVRDAVSAKRLPHVRIGKHVRFLRSELEDYVASRRVEGRSWR